MFKFYRLAYNSIHKLGMVEDTSLFLWSPDILYVSLIDPAAHTRMSRIKTGFLMKYVPNYHSDPTV